MSLVALGKDHKESITREVMGNVGKPMVSLVRVIHIKLEADLPRKKTWLKMWMHVRNSAKRTRNAKIIKCSFQEITAENARDGALFTILKATQRTVSTVKLNATLRPTENLILKVAYTMSCVSLKVSIRMKLYISNVHLGQRKRILHQALKTANLLTLITSNNKHLLQIMAALKMLTLSSLISYRNFKLTLKVIAALIA